MSDQMADLRARVERLEARLAAAASEVQRLRAESAHARTLRRVMTVVIGMIAVVFWTLPGETGNPTPLTVRAPFFVEDDAGKRLFAVYHEGSIRGFSLFRASGEISFQMAEFADGTTAMSIYGTPDTANVALGVVQGKNPDISLRYGGKRNSVLGLGVIDGKPMLNIKNGATGAGIVELGQGNTGGGRLFLGDKGGTARVLAGVAEGVGVVATSPGFNPGSLVPATFIKGCSQCGK